MKITVENLKYFNDAGIKHIKNCIVESCRLELELNGGENGDFDAMCEAGQLMNDVGHREFVSFIKDLEEFDKDDGFGSEGWEQRFGLGD